jgi:hypothetical protein
VTRSPAEIPPSPSRPFRTIGLAGLIAGVLDISSAFILWGQRGIGPVRGLQTIATGLLGPAAFEGGLGSAALGLAAHFLITFTAAALFYAASKRLRFLTQHVVGSGLAYGVAIYIFMNCVVLPLAAFKPKYTVSSITIGVLIIAFLVGLPIALIVRKFSRSEPEPKPVL